MIDTKAPVKKARYKDTTIFGKERIRPIAKANFASPDPIPLPLVINTNIKKNKKADAAEISDSIIKLLSNIKE